MLHFIAAGLLTALINHLGLGAWRRAGAAHWTERARLLWPVRVTAGMNIFLLPLVLNLWQQIFSPEPLLMRMANGLAALAGALLGSYPLEREIFPQLNFRNWRHQVAAGWGIRLSFLVALVMAGVLMPAAAGWGMLLVVVGYLAFHFAIQRGLVIQYLRLVKFMEPAGPRLQKIVDEAAARRQVPVRRTWQFGGLLANALAFPPTRELAFSTRLLEICMDEEIAAICAHELAHLAESKTILAGRLLGSLTLFPLIFIIPAWGYLGPAGIFLPGLGLVLISKFTHWLSQRLEKRADAAARSEQSNEGVYARALEKLYRENQIPAVNPDNKQTHPHLYDRMVAAGVTPDYPRPAKPRKMTGAGWLIIVAMGMAVGITMGQLTR